MSRSGVLSALRESETLTGLVDPEHIYPNYSNDERPSNTDPFIILRWRDVAAYTTSMPRAPRMLDIWVHIPITTSTSFLYLDSIIKVVDSIMTQLEQVDGLDGETITTVKKTGASGDLNDPGYNTICRYVSYDVLSHATVA